MQPKKVKSFEEFKSELESNLELQEEFKIDPVATIGKFKEQHPIDTDAWIYRIIVLGLSITIISIIFGVLILMGLEIIDNDTSVPTILTAIGSAAIGAVAGLLAPTPKRSSSE